ncbi:hypothetical protein B0H19DRAFT_1277227 [Mycena capillaripes]|nr:hypothetical protein B0H19DRAFT_1277227 [Mycena capillaripes]
MPPPPAIAARLDHITKALTITVKALEVLSDGLDTPFMGVISTTTRSLLTSAETVTQNKDEFTQLMEKTYELLNAIIIVYIKSGKDEGLPPNTLRHVGKVTE